MLDKVDLDTPGLPVRCKKCRKLHKGHLAMVRTFRSGALVLVVVDWDADQSYHVPECMPDDLERLDDA